MYSRRRFISHITQAGAAAMVSPLSSWIPNEIDPRVASIVTNTIGIDTHNHIDVPLISSELPGPKVMLAGEMKTSGLSAVCATFAVDYQKLSNPGEAYDRFLNGMNAMDAMLTSNHMKRALQFSDVQSAHLKKIPTVIQSVEGAHFLEGKTDRLFTAYQRGLRLLTLLHDSDASVPLGDVYTNAPQWGGLTAFGAEVITECNRLGILIDLTHASNDTLKAALQITKHPVVYSHTGLDTQTGKNEFMAKMMRPRLISGEQAKIIADAGGVIGVWTHLADTPSDYAQNIKAMVNAAGIDQVCVGTDTKLTPAYRSPKNEGFRPGNLEEKPGDSSHNRPQENDIRNDKNDKGTNDNKNGGRPGERTNEAWQDEKTGFYYTVVDALLKAGFNEEEIGKIGGGNFCRVFEEATSKHS